MLFQRNARRRMLMQSKRASHQPQSEAPATILSPRNPEDPHWEMQQVQLAIVTCPPESSPDKM